MKKLLVLSLICASSVVFTQCAKKTTASATKATKSAAAEPAATDPAAEVAALKSKYTPAQMAEGEAISRTSCVKCHEFQNPKDFTVKKLLKILPEMTHKANLTTVEAGKVRAWALTNAKAG